MVVIVLEKCPLSLRGDLSKWMLEVSLGVYVGKVGARVRDALWERVCAECKGGRATMVYSARNEQGLEFRTHNSRWQPVDFDGLKLIMRPNAGSPDPAPPKATVGRRRSRGARPQRLDLADYAVVDVETTGLDPGVDEIVEVGALVVRGGVVTGRFSAVVRRGAPVPDNVLRLTGISAEELSKGEELREAIERFGDVVGLLPWVGFNVGFDRDFINAACDVCGAEPFENQVVDVLRLAKKTLPRLPRHRLEDVAEYLGVSTEGQHRALRDCEITLDVLKLLMG